MQRNNESSTLTAILDQDGNKFCADCGSKNPRFVSILNLVIICDRCEEFHRLIGYECRTLQEIEKDSSLVAKLKQICNRQQRDYFELNKPNWYLSPSEIDSQLVRDKYIKRKYRERFFARQEGIDEKEEDLFYKKMQGKIKDLKQQKERQILMNNNWYYLKAEGPEIKTIGPLDKVNITGLLSSQEIDESFYVWHPTMKTWDQIIDVEELDFENRSFKIFKENKDLLAEIPIKWLKYVARSLRGYLDVRMANESTWKRHWVMFNNEGLSLFKTPDGKPTHIIKLSHNNTEDFYVEVCEEIKDKKPALVMVLKTSDLKKICFTHENVNEVCEWVHNLRKFSLFKAKFENQLPLYEDQLNPLKPNILDIEKHIESKVKCGNLMKESNGMFETGLQKKWFELTTDSFYYYDNQKDDVPKGQVQITASTRVYKEKDQSKYGAKTKSHFFKVEISKSHVLNLWDFTEESMLSWIAAFEKVIESKKKFQPKPK